MHLPTLPAPLSRIAFWRPILLLLAWLLLVLPSLALPSKLGDLDEDGVPTVLDVAKLAAHFGGTHLLSPEVALFADMNQDGALNEADQEALAHEILQLTTPRDLPLTTIREVSPARGEADVAVTRETTIHFTHPLWPLTIIDTTRFHADFGGRKILSSVQLALDRKKATLFYLEPLPSNTRVIVTFDGNGLNDLIGRPIDANGDGQPGGVFTTEFETISTQPVPNTGIVGIVYASERGTGGAEVPLAGVTITVDGAEETLRTVTGPNGAFTLNPCPSGTFFVHIDGRTAPASSYPTGAYYPSVGKKWFAVPGRIDNPAGDLDDTPAGGGTGVIYLPCICAGTLTAVSPVQDTIITFPASVLAANPTLAGTEIRVPANSLFADDGTRGGKVGIAPVAPDRLPSPLPPGLNPPIVFTVQSDGATNFDQPVPVCLPNLPDPVTGKKLEPGAKSALFSFNHDLGEWEIAGTMTVSEDGNCVTTDAGVGIRQPGWHTSQPGCLASGKVRLPCGPEAASQRMNEASEDFDHLLQALGFENLHVVGLAMKKKLGHYYDDLFTYLGANHTRLAAETTDSITRVLERTALERSFLTFTSYLLGPIRETYNCATGPLGATETAFACMKAIVEIAAVASGYHVIGALVVAVLSVWEANEIGKEIDSARLETFELLTTSGDCAQIDLERLNHAVDEARSQLDGMQSEARRIAGELSPILPGVESAAAVWDAAVDDIPNYPLSDVRVRELASTLDRFTPAASALSRYDSLRSTARALTGYLRKEIGEVWRNPSLPAERAILRVSLPTGAVLRLATNRGGQWNAIFPANSQIQITGAVINGGFRRFSGSVNSGNSGSVLDTGIYLATPPRADSRDTDLDGVADEIELTIGTDPESADTDGDGVSDPQEIVTNTLGFGSGAVSGSAAQTKVATSASDVSASSRTLAVACGSEGTAFLVARGIAAPVMRTRVPTSNWAAAVGMGANAALIAESGTGFRCVSLDEQLNVTFQAVLPVPGRAVSVVTSGGIGYGGTSGGTVLELDLASGGLLRQLETGAGEIEDLAVQGDWLFARKPDRLLAIPLNTATMSVAGQLVLSTGRTPSPNRLRIAVADGRVFCTKGDGVQIVNTASVPTMTLAGTVTGPGNNWRHFVPNGNVGVLAGKVQIGPPGAALPVPASLFLIPPTGNTATYATSYDMPGFTRAVALNRGIAYVACDGGSLAVVNYLDFDRNRQPPTITLTSNVNLAVPTPQVIEGSTMRLSASVTDDVQAGNVEFHVDGVLAFDDGTYPFEHRFVAPRRSLTKTAFKVKARAVDTGGNATWSAEFTITLLPDITPPTVHSFIPANGTMNRTVTNVYVRFNELMDPLTITPPALSLMEVGTDAAFDSADDVTVSYFPGYRDEDSLARLALNEALPPGLYRVRAAPPVADATGNAMVAAAESVFRVYSLIDTDNDGIPDDWEPLLGTNPVLADSNGNGTADGLEDRDSDGTPDGVEILRLGQDPRLADANTNVTPDGQEDSDSDGLRDGLEAVVGTSIFNSDTDGDGLDDNTEYLAGMNPLDSGNSLVLTAHSATASALNAAREITPLLPTPVTGPPTSVLNAAAEIAPVIPTPVQSGRTSFKNNSP